MTASAASSQQDHFLTSNANKLPHLVFSFFLAVNHLTQFFFFSASLSHISDSLSCSLSHTHISLSLSLTRAHTRSHSHPLTAFSHLFPFHCRQSYFGVSWLLHLSTCSHNFNFTDASLKLSCRNNIFKGLFKTDTVKIETKIFSEVFRAMKLMKSERSCPQLLTPGCK